GRNRPTSPGESRLASPSTKASIVPECKNTSWQLCWARGPEGPPGWYITSPKQTSSERTRRFSQVIPSPRTHSYQFAGSDGGELVFVLGRVRPLVGLEIAALCPLDRRFCSTPDIVISV